MDWLKTLVSNNTFLFFFAVIGIPMIVIGLKEIIILLIKHRERMAMIEHGMDPDAPNRQAPATHDTPKEDVAVSDLSK